MIWKIKGDDMETRGCKKKFGNPVPFRIDDETLAWLEKQVATGPFETVSQVVRNCIKIVRKQEEGKGEEKE